MDVLRNAFRLDDLARLVDLRPFGKVISHGCFGLKMTLPDRQCVLQYSRMLMTCSITMCPGRGPSGALAHGRVPATKVGGASCPLNSDDNRQSGSRGL